MKRKLMKMAQNTMVVSIPSTFVKKYNLKKSEEIDVLEVGRELRIRTENEIGKGKSLSLIDYEFFSCIHEIVYRCGFDKIEITLTNDDSLARLQLIAESLDYELFLIDKKKCVLEVINRIDSTQFENMLRRIFLIINQLDQMPTFKPTLEKLIDTCLRILHKCGHLDHSSSILLANLFFGIKQIIAIDEPLMIMNDIYGLYYQFSNEKLKEITEKIEVVPVRAHQNLLNSVVNTITSINLHRRYENTDQ